MRSVRASTVNIPPLIGKTVLVTGASGFIGHALCMRLLAGGAEVHALSRSATPDLSAGVHAWNADPRDLGSVQHVFSEISPSLVFHLAGHVYGSRSLDQVQPALTGNLHTTINILTAVVESGCERVIVTGSQDEPDTGEACATAFVPSSPYATSKFAGNAYARMFHALYECPVTVARIFMGYGPGQRDLAKLVPYVILSLLRGEAPQIGSGGRPMDWVYIDEIVEGLLRIACATDVAGRTVDLGTGRFHTGREAVECIVRLMGSRIKAQFGAVVDRKLEVARGAHPSATREMLGWQPTMTLEEGLALTIAWYRQRFKDGLL